MEMIENRLFRIEKAQSITSGLLSSGMVRDGRQALIYGSGGKDILQILWFDTDGNLLKPEVIQLPDEYANNPYPYWVNRVAEWVAEVGFLPQPIRVKQFCVASPFVADLRLLYMGDDVLQEPYCRADLEEAREVWTYTIETWLPRGKFMVRWGDYEVFDIDPKEPREWISPRKCPLEAPDGILDPNKRYSLRTPEESDYPEREFASGRLPDGRQAIFGRYLRNFVLVLFDDDGSFIGYETREIVPADEVGEWIEDDEWGMISEKREAWQKELGWRDCPILIGQFMLNEYPMYLFDYPAWALLWFYDPYVYPTPQERAEIRKQVEAWERDGWFVFRWGRDYQMNANGEIMST